MPKGNKKEFIFMVCPKCGGENVAVNVVNDVKLKDKHHNVFWWIFVGFWWIPIKWLFFTLPALIFKIFGRKKQKAINKQKKVCCCQSCGYTWDLKK